MQEFAVKYAGGNVTPASPAMNSVTSSRYFDFTIATSWSHVLRSPKA